MMRSTQAGGGVVLELALPHQAPWLPECKVKNQPLPFIRKTVRLARKDSRLLHIPSTVRFERRAMKQWRLTPLFL
jgi:hypothetical protein